MIVIVCIVLAAPHHVLRTMMMARQDEQRVTVSDPCSAVTRCRHRYQSADQKQRNAQTGERSVKVRNHQFEWCRRCRCHEGGSDPVPRSVSPTAIQTHCRDAHKVSAVSTRATGEWMIRAGRAVRGSLVRSDPQRWAQRRVVAARQVARPVPVQPGYGPVHRENRHPVSGTSTR